MPCWPCFERKPEKIAHFGICHNEFKKQVKKSLYCVPIVSVRHVKAFDGNFYLIEIQPKLSERRWTFTAKIKQDLENPQKSTLFRRAEKPESQTKPKREMQHATIGVDFSYHYNCARWLYSILCEHKFNILTLEVMFPPRCDILENLQLRNYLNRLEIRVDNEEQDLLLLIGWLENFDKNKLRNVRIMSEIVRIEVKMSVFLQNIHTLEIFGNSDVDLQWIYSSKTVKFVHYGRDNLILTDGEIKRICEHYMHPDSMRKILVFDQGTIERGEKLKRWLKEEYSDDNEEADYYQKNLDRGKMFYFQMKNRYLKFGKCYKMTITPQNETRFPEYQPEIVFD